MSWVKIDDQFPMHPKVVQSGPLGMAMQVAALCYCNRFLTDGFIPAGIVPTLINLTGQSETCEQLVDKLVQLGIWEEADGGYRIHDYLKYQPSKEDVLRDRQQKSDAGRKGAEARWQDSRSGAEHGAYHDTCNGTSHSTCHSTAIAEPMAKSCPVPDPVPVPNTVTQENTYARPSEGRPKKRAAAKVVQYSEAFLRFWGIYPRHEDKRDAWDCWQQRLSEGWTENDLVQAATNYAHVQRLRGTPVDKIKLPATFLGPKCPFEDYLAPPKDGNDDDDNRLALLKEVCGE